MRHPATLVILLMITWSSNVAAQKDTLRLAEHHIDSVHIGRPRHNKVELFLYENSDTSFVVLKFYSRQQSHWIIRQRFGFPQRELATPDPRYDDLNNDGFKDLLYVSRLDVRGANVPRKLFIYEKATDRFLYIKNSDDYPNLYYNKELNCINSWMLHSGVSTAFLRLRDNRLVQFAGVDLYGHGELDVYTVNKYGHSSIIRHDSTYSDPDRVTPFKNFSPLKRDYDAPTN